MKTKHINEILWGQITKSLETLSVHMNAKGQRVAFFAHENEAIHETVDTKTTVSYGFLIESQTDQRTRKLYFRKYDLSNKSLNDVKCTAYLEFLDVITGCFLITALSASDETLMKLSLNVK